MSDGGYRYTNTARTTTHDTDAPHDTPAVTPAEALAYAREYVEHISAGLNDQLRRWGADVLATIDAALPQERGR